MSAFGPDPVHGDGRSGWCMTRVAIRVVDEDGTTTWQGHAPGTADVDHEHCTYKACTCWCHDGLFSGPGTYHACPECLAGKHANCLGDALDPATDEVVPCRCACHEGVKP